MNSDPNPTEVLREIAALCGLEYYTYPREVVAAVKKILADNAKAERAWRKENDDLHRYAATVRVIVKNTVDILETL